MDRDDEIDKILKQKFENKILPSEEFENNMKKVRDIADRRKNIIKIMNVVVPLACSFRKCSFSWHG